MTEKFVDFFDPDIVKDSIHIIGCGAVGSTLAVMLARCGIKRLVLWDFDTVSSHNVANQQFMVSQVGKLKTQALAIQLRAINPQITLDLRDIYEPGTLLSGFVFLAVDNIELRHAIVKASLLNDNIKVFFDFRLRLVEAQHYAWSWHNPEERKLFLRTMDFTQAEVDANMPMSPCNLTMGIMPTVQMIVAIGVGNFINHLQGKPLKLQMVASPFEMYVD